MKSNLLHETTQKMDSEKIDGHHFYVLISVIFCICYQKYEVVISKWGNPIEWHVQDAIS